MLSASRIKMVLNLSRGLSDGFGSRGDIQRHNCCDAVAVNKLRKRLRAARLPRQRHDRKSDVMGNSYP
jgi:hypothetical protein